MHTVVSSLVTVHIVLVLSFPCFWLPFLHLVFSNAANSCSAWPAHLLHNRARPRYKPFMCFLLVLSPHLCTHTLLRFFVLAASCSHRAALPFRKLCFSGVRSSSFLHLMELIFYVHDALIFSHSFCIALADHSALLALFLFSSCALRQWRRGNLALITTLPVLDCLISV